MTRHMTEADVLDAARTRLHTAADKVHAVVDAARKLTSHPDIDDAFVVDLGLLSDAVQALDGTRLADTIRASERIVRGEREFAPIRPYDPRMYAMQPWEEATPSEVESVRAVLGAGMTDPAYDLPCGHTVFEACEACTPDPDDVARRDQEAAWATYKAVVLAEHEAGVDAFVARVEGVAK